MHHSLVLKYVVRVSFMSASISLRPPHLREKAAFCCLTAQLAVFSLSCFSPYSTFSLSVQLGCVCVSVWESVRGRWSCLGVILAEQGLVLYWSGLVWFSFRLSGYRGSRLTLIWPLAKMAWGLGVSDAAPFLFSKWKLKMKPSQN